VPGFLYHRRGAPLFAFTFVLGLGGFMQARAARDREALERCGIIAAGLLMCAASVIAQGRYFAYHFVALAPFCAALCLFGLRQLPALAPWPNTRGALSIAAILVVMLIGGPRWCTATHYSYGRYITRLTRYWRGEIDRADYLEPFVGYSPFDTYVRMERVAKVVSKHARAGDTLCVRGFLTPLYALTGLSCTSRHIVQEIVDSGLPSWPAEYARDLEKTPPSFIVTFVDRSADLHELKARGYRAVGIEDGLVVFEQGQRVAAEIAQRRRAY
jgi:hypothetical protein